MMLSSSGIRKRILEDKYNALIFKRARGNVVYLVGGYLRDMIIGVRSHDRDYIVSGNLMEFVRSVQKRIGGTLIEFKKGSTVRLALKDENTLDFSEHSGPIEDDLSKRDYTINALAWSPEAGIIDLYEGIDDLRKKRIRCVAIKNLNADPLRILRAYRFAAEINGFIEKDSRNILIKLHKMIKDVPSERITLEFFHLLNSEHPSRYLRMCYSDGLLGEILPIKDSILTRNIRVVSKLEEKIIPSLKHQIKVLLDKIISQNLNYRGLLTLEILLNGHSTVFDNTFKIKLSNSIVKRIQSFNEGMKCFSGSRERLFDVFMITGNIAVDMLIIRNRMDLYNEYLRFMRIWKRGLLSSKEMMLVSGLSEGKKLGKLIELLKKAEFKGKIKTKKQAIKIIDIILHNISYRT